MLTNKDQILKMLEPSKYNDNNHCQYQPARSHRQAQNSVLQQIWLLLKNKILHSIQILLG